MKIKELKELLNHFDDELEIISGNMNLSDLIPLNFLGLYEHKPSDRFEDGYVVLVTESEFIEVDTCLSFPSDKVAYNIFDMFCIYTDDGAKWFKFDLNGDLIEKE